MLRIKALFKRWTSIALYLQLRSSVLFKVADIVYYLRLQNYSSVVYKIGEVVQYIRLEK